MRDRMDCWLLVVTLGVFCLSLLRFAEAQAQTGAAAGAPAADERANAMAAMRERQNATPDTPGTGRYPALKEEVASLPDHVIYRPADLGKLGSHKLGVYVFGNGACSNDGASARLHLLEIASHGYLAIAPGRVRNGPGRLPPEPPRAPSA